jgi:ribosomal protein S18 acetylase RimI-like enzyme
VILPAEAHQLDAVREIFREYAAWVGDDICFASFEKELAALPGRYAPPGGCLLLDWQGDGLAACAALREFAPEIGEMKRLYVRPEFRSLRLGRALIDRIVEESRTAGHRVLRLDTLPKMQRAIALYRELGFREIPHYSDNPPTSICFELRLF